MSVFGDYSHYYNLLYSDKDYAEETRFIAELMAGHGLRPRSLLDLGCGTGKHACCFADADIRVVGVDKSESKLRIGRKSLERDPVLSAPVDLRHGDACNVRLGIVFDAVTSLFHVMSYQTSDESAQALLATAREHLAPGGLFFFDFWHSAGVLSDPPVERLKIMEDESVRVERKAIPRLRVPDNIVEVRYTIHLHNKLTGQNSDLAELHVMRYRSVPELRSLARSAGFVPLDCGAWMELSPPRRETWYAWMLLRRE
ncbi:MAG: class I SAM-dependent methyltransferase [Desulfovibrio sp.]|jgi:SAM-dependent methyltransferase|nr:class I SAM-dependent methyltransferase [Desulfovibrio sp.]